MSIEFLKRNFASVFTEILLILPSCPNFCLTRYIGKAGPPINLGIQTAADRAARLNAKLVAASDKFIFISIGV